MHDVGDGQLGIRSEKRGLALMMADSPGRACARGGTDGALNPTATRVRHPSPSSCYYSIMV